MYEITVKLPTAPYRIQIESGSLNNIGGKIQSVSAAENILVVSDYKVWELHGGLLVSSLERAGYRINTILIEPGEKSKNIDCLKEICEEMARLNVRRDHLVIAFGGGVVGDIAGFASAVYMRGLPYVQVPTTLLAQVDSSVGGKTAIDLSAGKNMIGAFHQPALVVIDPGLLVTLDKGRLSDGMAEVVKYGVVYDEGLFAFLESLGGIDGLGNHIEEIIYRCCNIKRILVEEDERDTGERRKLNFGHSFGHAIERMGDYKDYSHGEAVAIGMVLASQLGENMGMTEKGTGGRIAKLLRSFNLPTDFPIEFACKPQGGYPDLVHAMKVDKKNEGENLSLVLVKKMGDSIIENISQENLLKLLKDQRATSAIKVLGQRKDIRGSLAVSVPARISVPPSKSYFHRALICGALAGKGTVIKNTKQRSEDVLATLAALKSFGLKYEGETELKINAGIMPNTNENVDLVTERKNYIKVNLVNREEACIKEKPRHANNGNSNEEILFNCGESGSTLRFMIPLALLSNGKTVITGTERLFQRPLKELLDALEKNGAMIQTEDKCIRLQGPLKPGIYEIPGNVSSQFVSGLLMALPMLDDASEIRLTTELESKPYVDMTVKVMSKFGILIDEKNEGVYRVRGNQQYSPCSYSIEGDFSAAAYFLVAGALGYPVECAGLNIDSLQGDKRIIDFIHSCGGRVIEVEKGVVKGCGAKPHGIIADISQCPDLAPPLAVLLSFCKGESRIVGAGRLKMKESDRLKSISEMLRALGASVTEGKDYLVIRGVDELKGGEVYPYNDHRIAMAAAIASLRSTGQVVIHNPQCVNKSYPNFFKDFAKVK